MLGPPTEQHSSSAYAIHHLDHAGYTECHPHNIEHMENTQTYTVA